MRLTFQTILIILLICGTSPGRVIPATGSAEERIYFGRLDPAAPTGLVFVAGTTETPGTSIFGVRVLAYRPARMIEATSPVEFDAAGIDGSVGRLSWKSFPDQASPLILEWCRLTPATIAVRVTGPPSIRILIETYHPFTDASPEALASAAPMSRRHRPIFLADADHRSLRGEQLDTGPSGTPRRRFMLKAEQRAQGAATYRDVEIFLQQLAREGHARSIDEEPSTGSYHRSALSYDLAENNSINFVMSVGKQWESIEEEIRTAYQRPISENLTRTRETWNSRRPAGEGAIAGGFDQLYQFLATHRRFDPAGRSPYFAGPPSTGKRGNTSDSLYLGMMGAMIDPVAAVGTIRQVLNAQQPDGRVPPWSSQRETDPLPGGRSMLPVAAFATLKTYLATGDLRLLANAWPRLRLWNEWWHNDRGDGQPWRDGNRDGLLEWGFNEELEFGSLGRRQLSPLSRYRLALDEAGWTSFSSVRQLETPVFNDQRGTLEQNSVALNALYALDTECLSLIARELGLSAEADQLWQRYQTLRRLINSSLWDEQSGSYVDRNWNGQAIRTASPANFLPLAAGLPDPDRLTSMMAAWKPIRESLATRTAPHPDSNAWMTYLLYYGLRRHDRHLEAMDLIGEARREGVDQGLEATLSRWLSIEELYCPDPVSGLNLGSRRADQESRLLRLTTPLGLLDLTFGPTKTLIRRNGKIELECDAPVRMRNYLRQERTLTMTIEAEREARLTVPGEPGRKITVSVDNNIIGSTSIGAAASFRLPRGTHRLLIVR